MTIKHIPLAPVEASAQSAFARAALDTNPIHLDGGKARQSIFGQVIVHGLHNVLLQLNALSKAEGLLPEWLNPRTRIRVSAVFKQPIHIGDVCSARIKIDPENCKLSSTVFVDHLPVCTLKLEALDNVSSAPSLEDLGTKSDAQDIVLNNAMMPLFSKNSDLIPVNKHFNVNYGNIDREFLKQEFLHATKALGLERLSSLTALSSLVGVVVPGMYSLFSSFVAELEPEATEACNELSYSVKRLDSRFNLIETFAHNAQFSARVEAFQRPGPVQQPSSAEIATCVEEASGALNHVVGRTAIVVGGSRGLGSVCARLLAEIGATVTVTYASSKDAAIALASDLSPRARDRLKIQHFDVNENNSSAAQPFDQLYYFASPNIFERKTKLLDPELLDRFNAFYVSGFWSTVRRFTHDRSLIFYPSTVALDENDEKLLEYRLSKTSGEMLIHTLEQKVPQTFVIERLPRLYTDQTAHVLDTKTANTLKVLTACISKMKV